MRHVQPRTERRKAKRKTIGIGIGENSKIKLKTPVRARRKARWGEQHRSKDTRIFSNVVVLRLVAFAVLRNSIFNPLIPPPLIRSVFFIFFFFFCSFAILSEECLNCGSNRGFDPAQTLSREGSSFPRWPVYLLLC